MAREECPAMPGSRRCPEWVCDCFIAQFPEDPLGLHPEVFRVGPPPAEWVWVSLPWATFGLRVEGGRVVEAPPIARWAVGRDEAKVADYYRARGARFERLRP